MERSIFNGLFKDLMTHIFDFAVLETHPLVQELKVPKDYRASRSRYTQEIIFDEISQFKPINKELSVDAIEWRPYLILHKRYVEGMGVQELADYLAISTRQMRRDHSRALQALSVRLWDKIFQDSLELPSSRSDDGTSIEGPGFESSPEALDIAEVIEGVTDTLKRHLEAEDISISLELSNHKVLGDRVILRQILISLFNYSIHIQRDNRILVRTRSKEGAQKKQIDVEFVAAVDQEWNSLTDDVNEDLLETAKSWSALQNATLVNTTPAKGQSGVVTLILSLPQAKEATVLVVDDQQPTIRMYQRYLSRSNFKVIGMSDPGQVFACVKQIRPDLILLDVMMPQIDGWEILQKLSQDKDAKHIPVIVCSAWETSDLARSLGAASFLKKPITQESLLSAISQVGIK